MYTTENRFVVVWRGLGWPCSLTNEGLCQPEEQWRHGVGSALYAGRGSFHEFAPSFKLLR